MRGDDGRTWLASFGECFLLVAVLALGAPRAFAAGTAIANIDEFLNQCPSSDPIYSQLLADFQIRSNGIVVPPPPCTEPVSAMPIAQYTDALIALQGLRTAYYIDRQQSGLLPWTSQTFYGWMKSRVGGINFKDGVVGGYCCDSFDGKLFFVTGPADDFQRDFDRKWEGISGNIGFYAHEVRHADPGAPGHSSCCGIPYGCDDTYDESNLSSFGVQWWLEAHWLTGALDVGYACLSPSRVQAIARWHLDSANGSFRTRFCTNPPPLLSMPDHPGGQCEAARLIVPIVLDVVGLAHYTSDLQLTNLGASATTVTLSYTASMGSGSGDVTETIPPGQQVVYPDAISYLRFRGIPIPTSGNQGGTLLFSPSAAGVHATVRTGADTAAPQPVGRSGLAYTDTDPAASSSATKVYVYGLRTSHADRSNLAVYNMGSDGVWLKVTLVSGDDGRSFEVTTRVPLVLPAYGWYQYFDVLNAAGFSSGYAIVERVNGSGPFGAYGVVNDQKTNDGSFISALSGTLSGSRLTIPVLVEASPFESELILTNRGSATATFTLRYLESISPVKGAGGTATVDVAAGRQVIIPKAIDFLRSKGISIGTRGEASYAGILQVQVSGVGLENVFAGARTSSLSLAGGEFGVFYPGIGSSQEFSELAFILGLKADVNNRSNVAVLHTGDGTSGPITLELQVLDGSEGGKAVGQLLSVTLNPGQWAQPAGFFASSGVPNGYVRIRRTAGTAPWYAYGVINDGGNPGQRTGDGSYVPGVHP